MTQPANPSNSQLYLRLITYVRPYWYAFVVSFLGFSLYAATQAGFAKWLEYVVDSLGTDQLEQRGWLALAVVGLFVVRGVGSFLGAYSIAYAARHVVHVLRMSLFDQLLKLPHSYFAQEAQGQLLSRLTYNVEQVTDSVTIAVRLMLREGLTVIGLMGYLFWLNWQLTLILFVAMPFVGFVVSRAAKRFRTISGRIQQSVGDVAHVASEVIAGVDVVRIFGGQGRERARFHQASENNRRQFMKQVVTEAVNTPLVQLIVAVALAALVYVAMHPDLMRDMTPGQAISFITAAGMIAKPLRQLTEINSIIQRGLAAAQSLFEVLDSTPELNQGERQCNGVNQGIEFREVAFRYGAEGSEVLAGLNFAVKPGESIALVGRSGSGKSTLVSLLSRFNNPVAGQILLDGVPLSEYELTSLRSQIALVNQQVVLFDGTIAENIAYGELATYSEAQIQAAAIAAHVTEFTDQLPEGLNTLLGTGGVSLSGGQKQRVAIARAILKNSPILILDEATSALDSESERHIQEAMDNVMKGRTTFVIAHRLSTIEHVDRILVMDSGRLVESGSHQQLLALDGYYARLHRLQYLRAKD